MAGFYDIFGKYLGPNSSAMCKSSFDHVIHAEKFDEMLEGTEMVLNGLQLIVQGAKTIDVKAIERDNAAISKASGADEEVKAYSKNGFDNIRALISFFKEGDDVPDAVLAFEENLEKNMQDSRTDITDEECLRDAS